MNCKQAEQLIIDSTEIELDPKTKNELDIHILTCPKCLSFRVDFQAIRLRLKRIPMPTPSSQLLEKTMERCHTELIKQDEALVLGRIHAIPVTTPRWILIALAGLVVLSIITALPGLTDFIKNHSVSNYIIIAAIILIQNIIMLLFTPILLRLKALKNISDHAVLNGI